MPPSHSNPQFVDVHIPCLILTRNPCAHAHPGDRPTIFIEIIERVGCLTGRPAASGRPVHSIPGTSYACSSRAGQLGEVQQERGSAQAEPVVAVQGFEVDYEVDKDIVGGVLPQGDEVVIEQAAGCGGFGKGNFSELFKR